MIITRMKNNRLIIKLKEQEDKIINYIKYIIIEKCKNKILYFLKFKNLFFQSDLITI